MITQTFTCEWCKKTVTKEFESYRGNRVVCSEECRRKRNLSLQKENYKQKNLKTLRCGYCEQIFIQTELNQKYCSKECENKSSKIKREKKAQGLVEFNKKAREVGMTYGQYQAYLYKQNTFKNDL